MKIHARISSQFDENGPKTYDVLPGATFTDTYNEELDSGSIIITHIKDRMEGLAPYDWVWVFSDDGELSKTMLVDDFSETRPNIFEPYYEYTINLMSETKLLEKIQLPNRQWLHEYGKEGLHINQVIGETCALYIPKAKFKTDDGWRYYWIIEYSDFFDPKTEAYAKFDKPMADLPLSQPTLRQALSAMMSQVGCLPIVKNGKLSYLDMRAEPKELEIVGNTFAQTQKSNASDSYVTELVCQGDSILDSENACVSETLGFRDRTKAFLKQTENLYLETRYPIYRVTSLIMHAWMESRLGVYLYIGDRTVYYNRSVISIDSAGVSVGNVTFTGGVAQTMHLTGVQITYGKVGSDYRFRKAGTAYLDDSAIVGGSTGRWSNPYPTDYPDFAFAAYWVERKKWIAAFSWMDISQAFNRGDNVSYYCYSEEYSITRCDLDISKLCVENGKRSLLDADFMQMTTSNITSADDLAKYLYGTVGYDVGGKTIEGFSSTYEYFPANSWWQAYNGTRTVTYIENMTGKLLAGKPFDTETLQSIYFADNGARIIADDDWVTLSVKTQGTKENNFSNWFFDVEYQPLNSLSVSYSKSKEAAFPLQQLDTPKSSLSAMDAMSASEQELVERLGNDVSSWSQYADDEHWKEIGFFDGSPLKIGDDVIFQITYSYDLNGTAVNYFGSKGSVLRNYFTSVQTKYRSYAYVPYEQAIVRKENVKVYALMSRTKYPNMDEKITFGTLDGLSRAEESRGCLLSPFRDWEHYDEMKIANGYRKSGGVTYKNEASVVTYKTNVILNQEEFDAISAGLSLIRDGDYNNIGAGVPQQWRMTDNTTALSMGWMGGLSEIWTPNPFNPTEEELEFALDAIAGMPLLTGVTTLPTKDDASFDAYTSIVSLQDWANMLKDDSELLNVSLQIEYYNDDDTIEFGDFFADAISWKCGNGGEWKKGVLLADYGDRGEWSIESPTGSEIAELGGVISVSEAEMSVTVKGNPGEATSCRVVMWRESGGKYLVRDVAEFLGTGERKYWLRLNDTRTVRCFTEDGGIKHLGYLIPEEN